MVSSVWWCVLWCGDGVGDSFAFMSGRMKCVFEEVSSDGTIAQVCVRGWGFTTWSQWLLPHFPLQCVSLTVLDSSNGSIMFENS